jgi:hypothetical protein
LDLSTLSAAFLAASLSSNLLSPSALLISVFLSPAALCAVVSPRGSLVWSIGWLPPYPEF